MKNFVWDNEKNLKLIKERKISFEEIIYRLQSDGLLDIIEHHNPKKYGGQKFFVVELNKYCYLVPFIETTTEYILKTIYPSRKATKIYLKNKR